MLCWQVVLDLLAAKPEQRAAEANKLLGYMCINSMSGYVWVRHAATRASAASGRARARAGRCLLLLRPLRLTVRRAVQDELCRTRKNKPLPGLTIITEMIDSQGTQAPRRLRFALRCPGAACHRHALQCRPGNALGLHIFLRGCVWSGWVTRVHPVPSLSPFCSARLSSCGATRTGKKHLRSGQDPSLQILALASVNQVKVLGAASASAVSANFVVPLLLLPPPLLLLAGGPLCAD